MVDMTGASDRDELRRVELDKLHDLVKQHFAAKTPPVLISFLRIHQHTRLLDELGWDTIDLQELRLELEEGFDIHLGHFDGYTTWGQLENAVFGAERNRTFSVRL